MIDRETVRSPAPGHDHDLCLANALARARAACVENDLKWTALREQVFRVVASSHTAVSAYDLIDSIAAGGRRLAPISVYRVLDVLQRVGLVHRLESRNAYFACMEPHGSPAPQIVLLCEDCGRVTESEASEALNAISKTTEARGFRVRSAVLEVRGVCEDCQASAA